MPIDFAPPIEQGIQPFNVPAPQYSDPLQTLAEMGQMKQQAIQTQQAQMDLQSQQGFMRAYLDANGDPEQAIKLAPQYGVLPKDIYAAQKMLTDALQAKANLKKTDRENHDAYLDRVHAAFQPMFDAADDPNKQAALAASIQQDLLNKGTIKQPLFQYTDPESAKLFEATLNTEKYTTAQATLLGKKTEAAKEAAEEPGLIAKSEQEQKANTASLLTNATDPTAYDTIRDRYIAAGGKDHPERAGTFPSARQVFDQNNQWVPGMQDLVNRTGLTSEQLQQAKLKEPEYRIQKAQADAMASMKPEDWDTYVDKVIPASGDTAALNWRTKGQVHGAISQGLPLTAVNAIVKDASDQIGRTETGVRTAKATAPIKVYTSAAEAQARSDAAGLTDDDYARAGEQYARTGVMPALGRDSITRGKVVRAANQWARDNGLSPGDVVTMQAAYAGDKESLKKFQSQRDQIVSFEQTAQKNLDLFLNAAAKIPDTGIPWLNTPIRNLDAKIVGSENMAAVNAARQVANNEIAKVTSGGGMGGVLSDSARHEVEGYNPANATFAQTKKVAEILRADMANRHGSMDATLSDIKSRIGGGGAQNQPLQYVRTSTDLKTKHQIGQTADGKWHDVQTGAVIQ